MNYAMRSWMFFFALAAGLSQSACGGSSGSVSAPPVATTPAVQTPPVAAVNGNPSLKRLASFPVGACVAYGNEAFAYNNLAAQQTVLKKHFSQLTACNIMKMSYLHPGETTFNYTQADDFLRFATDNSMSVHGHALIWHSDYQVPDWMKNYAGDKAAWIAMLKNHVNNIVTHFAGKVNSWDVVNEALQDGGGYRNSVFYQNTGADYIEQAFISARAADANVDLYYNDYNTEADTAKLKTMTDMLDGFVARKVPISGVGFQMHIYSDYPSVATLKASMQQIVDRNLKVKITELDIPINNPYGSAYRNGDIKTVFTPELALAQKQRYCEVIKAYMETVPAHLRGGITVWGVTDPGSWLIQQLFSNRHDDWPLLFDKDYNEKPALKGVADGLAGNACTNLP
jgi:endo-1,4-beta-xylanase